MASVRSNYNTNVLIHISCCELMPAALPACGALHYTYTLCHYITSRAVLIIANSHQLRKFLSPFTTLHPPITQPLLMHAAVLMHGSLISAALHSAEELYDSDRSRFCVGLYACGLQRSNSCLMRTASDVFLVQSWRTFRQWTCCISVLIALTGDSVIMSL